MVERHRRIIFWCAVLSAAILTRFATLGLQSPWLDEVMNWQIADAQGLNLRPIGAHKLSYLLQAAGLALSDSVFGLRLYSAVFGTFAVVAGVAYARHVGKAHAAAAVVLFLLSPFCLFYSQDANHYAPLLAGGIFAAFAVDWFLEGGFAPFKLIVALLLIVLSVFVHPFGAICVGTLGLVVLIWFLARVDRFAPKCKLNPRAIRLIAALVFTAAGAWFVRPHLNMALRAAGPRLLESRRPGLAWEPWQALLGDFFGATYHHRVWDAVLGITGFFLCCAGYVLIARRRPFAAIGASIMIAAAVAPFLIFDFAHYFSPRYLTAAVPALLLGIAFLTGETWERRAARWARIAFYATCCWLAAFGARAAWWQAHRATSHQPTYEAIEWIRRNLPEDSIIVTRHRYSSRALEFLWHRFDMRALRHVSADHVFMAGAPAIQQIEELAAANPNVYFTTLINDELLTDRDFAQWLARNSTRVAYLPSGSPDEYIPFDWSIGIYKIKKPAKNPLALPRDGSRASVLSGTQKLRVSPGLNPQVAFTRGTGAGWRFELGRPVDGLVLRINRRTVEEDLRWITGGIRGGSYAAWNLANTTSQTLSLVYGEPLQPGDYWFDLHFPSVAASSKEPQTILSIGKIGTLDQTDLPGNAITGELLHHVPVILPDFPKSFAVTPSDPELVQQFEGHYDLAPDAQVGFIVQIVSIRGLGDRSLNGRAVIEGKSSTLFQSIDLTSDKAMTAAILPSLPESGTIRFDYHSRSGTGRYLYNPIVVLDAPALLVLPATRQTVRE